uniref:(northern house mosquito) hypothetical protein n=1 Tax=Culex pipiens TaxID=7175 RepID=A0A8D8AY56_CULPI
MADGQNLLDRKHGAISIVGGRGANHEAEKSPFLPTEPVRLTPAWEENNLPNDELNFKGKNFVLENSLLHHTSCSILEAPFLRITFRGDLIWKTKKKHSTKPQSVWPGAMFATKKIMAKHAVLTENLTVVDCDGVPS